MKDDVRRKKSLGILDSTGLPSIIWMKVMLSSLSCVTDTLRSILYSLVITTQIVSPDIYVFQEVSFSNAIPHAHGRACRTDHRCSCHRCS